MRLSQALVDQVPSQSRARGHAYFTGGAVRGLTSQDGIVEATVRGSELYHVWLEPRGDLIRASCTCPFFLDRHITCKHIWAVILAAEAQAIPLVAPGVLADAVDLEYMAPEPLDDVADRDDAWSTLVVGRPRKHPRRPPPWRTLLDSIAAAAPAIPLHQMIAAGQLLYVVDIAATNASGALVIELNTRERKANGDWGKPKPARVSDANIASLTDAAERDVLDRLVGARPHLEWSAYATLGPELTRVQLRGVMVADMLPRMCATGRCFARILPAGAVPGAPSLVPLEWDTGSPWAFAIGVEHTDAPDGYVVDGWLQRDGEQMKLADALSLLADGVVITSTHAARLQHGGAFTWLTALQRAGRVVVPAAGREALINALLIHQPLLAAAPADLRVETISVPPQPYLRLRPVPARADRLSAEVLFDYDGTLVLADSPHQVVRPAGASRAIRRDTEAERRLLALLFAQGVRNESNYQTGLRGLQVASQLLPRLARSLLDEGWRVEAEGRPYRRPSTLGGLNVASGIDWFELSADVAYGDQHASLPALLAALDRGDGFVMLDDGSLGFLPEDWLRRYAPIARLGSREGSQVRFKRSQAALIDALLATQPDASWDDTFARARAELARFDGIAPVDPPPTFSGTLRGYQRDGLGWLMFLQRFGFGGCLADDMGLGKTVMVLALLEMRRTLPDPERRPSLVVAPRSVVFNWKNEARRFTPASRVLEYTGGSRASMRGRFSEYDLILTTYGTLRRDAAELRSIQFDYVVLDEAQAIKNASSISARTTRVLNARHRLALSGTPIENHLGELWSLFEFLNPGLLGTAPAFASASTIRQAEDDALPMLARGLRPFILRRTKDQVARELPARTEQTLYCDLERPQRALYDELRGHYRRALLGSTEGLGKGKLQILEALLRLRQAACHQGLIDKRRSAEPSAKLDVLVPRLAEAVEEGHKTLVFSQFTSLLAILRTRLDEEGIAYEYLDGRSRDREAKVERFQHDPQCGLFLISLKAGGVGLNLTAAEYVFLLDPWWNPAVEAQAIDRAHRIGQTRHVFAYRLIARDTVEERVLELQAKKRGLADAILNADNRLLRDLRREDLELLLS